MKTTNKIIKTWAGAVLSPLATFLPRSLKLKGLSVLVLFAALAAAPGAYAQSNGGGLIYYYGPWAPGPTAATTTMNSDGNNKTLIVIEGYVGVWGIPSRALHNNHRWFVRSERITGQYYPNGTPRREVFARRDDTLIAVQLTDDITLESDGRADWVPGDGRISFKARRWSSAVPGATVVAGGLYTAALAFDGAGNITGLAAPPTTPAIPFPLVEAAPADLWPDLSQYCWGPLGDRIAYNNYTYNELWVTDPLNGHTRIFIGATQSPQWSPDGAKIVFTHGGIVTIKPNGGSFKTIVRSTSTWILDEPLWSPDSSYIIFTGYSNSNFDVYRTTALGARLTNLTSTPTGDEHSYGGWR